MTEFLILSLIKRLTSEVANIISPDKPNWERWETFPFFMAIFLS